MLRIECYPVLDELVVRIIGHQTPSEGQVSAGESASVTRKVPHEYAEQVGLETVIREVVVDVVTEYPGLLSWAVK